MYQVRMFPIDSDVRTIWQVFERREVLQKADELRMSPALPTPTLEGLRGIGQ
jgi:hypothetical protein